MQKTNGAGGTVVNRSSSFSNTPWCPCAALAAAVVLSLSACGGGGDSSGAAGAPSPADLSSGSAAPGPAPAPAAFTSACAGATGRVLEVGAGQTYAKPSAAAAVAQNGDVIKIAAGEYRGDVAVWNASNLTICGGAGRARLYADGKNAGGKGIWVVYGSNFLVENVDFHDAAVPDGNGAGIRAQGAGTLTVRYSGFFDNEDGILGGLGNVVAIEHSEFARNGRGDGQTHAIYIDAAERLTVTSSFFHETKVGHNLKSRAKESHVENSYFMDGPTGTASYQADFPNGGTVYLRGNVFQKGPLAQNSHLVAFAAEGVKWPTNTLTMVHNTLVSTRSGGVFLYAPATTQAVTLTANLFAGTNNPGLIDGGFLATQIIQQNNLTSTANHFAAPAIAAPDFWPDAALQSQTMLGNVPDAGYAVDSPQPFVTRTVDPSRPRRIGALQSTP